MDAPRRSGVDTDEELSKFGRLVGRKFSRFAFPDEITYWFKPLETVAQSKHSKPESPEGKLFAKVEELRVELDAYWAEPPYDLTLVVILKEDVLPTFAEDEFPDISDDLSRWIRPNDKLRSADQIAARLVESSDSAETYLLWQALAEAWAGRCRPRLIDMKQLGPLEKERVRDVVNGGEISVDLTSVDDFSMYRYQRSEMLDLEHLSPVHPLFAYPQAADVAEPPIQSSDKNGTTISRFGRFLRHLGRRP
jgi:hypothetical protein